MQSKQDRRKEITIIVIVLIVLIGLVLLVGFLFQSKSKNQFGNFIRIQNYDQKVKNLSPDMRDAMESYLYNIVKHNSKSDFDATTVKDAYIREGSDSQNLNQTGVYNGTFIIDMASIKQSYQTQYSYSSNAYNTDVGGNPVVISCLPKEKLIYGEFNCTDFVSQQSSANDVILQYLPYQNFSFKITPDATQGNTLVLNVELTIPDSDINGDLASKQHIVALYKQQVTDWITSKGANPSKYTIKYNYDDNGNLINQAPLNGD